MRFALSGQRIKRLDGSSGWIEHERCPLFTIGKRDVALAQLLAMINEPQPPIFIAVAGFAQFNSEYSERVAPFKAKIADHSIVVISADTEQGQLYQWHISGKKPEHDKYFLDFHYCTPDNAEHCVSVLTGGDSKADN